MRLPLGPAPAARGLSWITSVPARSPVHPQNGGRRQGHHSCASQAPRYSNGANSAYRPLWSNESPSVLNRPSVVVHSSCR